MKVSVPAAAPTVPPDTGASSISNPAARAASSTVRALATSIVEQSISSGLGPVVCAISIRPPWCNQTSRTCSPAGSIVMMMSAPAAASAALAAAVPPVAASAVSAAALRS